LSDLSNMRNLDEAFAERIGCGPSARTTCWPPRRRRAPGSSWPRASPGGR